MAVLRVKQADGTWVDIPTIVGKYELTEKDLEDIVSALGGGNGYIAGDNISITNGVISVITTNEAEKDNTRPITSAGVYATVGNIEALLKTI